MQRVSLPITLADDQQALQVALRCCGQPPEEARLVFIHDTLLLDHLWVSPSLRSAVEAHPRLVIQDEVPLRFSAKGVMTMPWQMAD